LRTSPPSGLPVVDTVTSTPLFGSDGSLLLAPGLYRDERLWLAYHPALPIRDVPERPSAEEVASARSLFFDDLFGGISFRGSSDRAHLLAAMLLPFVRRMIPWWTPAHLVETVQPGAGASVLCDLVCLIATGACAEPAVVPTSDRGLQRLLTSELKADRTVIVLDAGGQREILEAPDLCVLITATEWSVRIPGTIRMLTLPNNAVWMLTGSQLRLSKRLERRVIRIRLAPAHGRRASAASVSEKHKSLRSWAHAHRAELVRAVLVLVRAWLAAGRPQSSARFGGFESWTGLIGGILDVAGVHGKNAADQA